MTNGDGSNYSDRPASSPTFDDLYVFPDGELLPIHTTLQIAEESGFKVGDVESLRKHNALTLRRWARSLEASYQAALKEAGEVTCRVWRLFMSGAAHGFSTGRLNLYQALLTKPDGHGRSGLPLTRAGWYSVDR